MRHTQSITWFAWWLGWLGFAVFSYALTAPNLILSHFEPYWQFQTWMWHTFFDHRPLLTYTYLALITYLSLTSGWLVWHIVRSKWPLRWPWLVLTGATLLAANNALSYDVFNYIFNARMVMVYQANPHVKVALDFVAIDDWTRFMHNTHTPAPYGYGWTVWSLIPYTLGLGKFTLTWEWFRIWSFLSLISTAAASQWLVRAWWGTASKPYQLWHRWQWAVWLNPLVLIELITNSHNDGWMMAPAIVAFGAIFYINKTKPLKTKLGWLGLSVLALAASASIKYATLVLLPIWLMLVLARMASNRWPTLTWIQSNWPWLASICLFLPLLSARSQLFHPWYLTWSLIWIPLGVAQLAATKSATNWPASALARLQAGWWLLIWTFSFSSLLRYIPYLWVGQHTAQTLLQQQLITWSAVPIALGLWLGWLIRAKFTRAK